MKTLSENRRLAIKKIWAHPSLVVTFITTDKLIRAKILYIAFAANGNFMFVIEEEEAEEWTCCVICHYCVLCWHCMFLLLFVTICSYCSVFLRYFAVIFQLLAAVSTNSYQNRVPATDI